MSKTEKTIVVTGANSGIGLATSKLLVSNGCRVIMVGRNAQQLVEHVGQIGRGAAHFVADVSNIGQIDAMYRYVIEMYGEIDGVVVNAGTIQLGSISEVTEKTFDEQFDVNVKGAFFTAQKAVPVMKRGGSIVFNASYAGHKSFSKGAVYCATKAAVISIAKSMALELAGLEIRVNSVSPGNIDTPIFDKLGLTDDDKTSFFESFKNRVPLRRSGVADEIAKTISFLLSDESSYITGADLLVDGGLMLAE